MKNTINKMKLWDHPLSSLICNLNLPHYVDRIRARSRHLGAGGDLVHPVVRLPPV